MFLKNLSVILAVTFSSLTFSNAQQHLLRKESGKELNKKFYFYWGYNRTIFTHSDIHLSGANYDITLFNLTAHDRPSPFTIKEYFGPATLSIPQYNYRIGYGFSDRFSISFGMDHMKYVMDANQKAKLSGVISPAASVIYAGSYLDTLITVTPDFLSYEHTNGLNFLSLEIEYTLPLFSFFDNKLLIDLNTGMGGVWMIPKTDVRVFGYGLNNDFHVAGYSMSAKAGPQIRVFHHYFLRAQAKAGYVTLPNVLIHNDAPDHAVQNFGFMESFIVAGILFPFKISPK